MLNLPLNLSLAPPNEKNPAKFSSFPLGILLPEIKAISEILPAVSEVYKHFIMKR